MKTRHKQLEKIVEMIKVNRNTIHLSAWFKLAGWIISQWNFEEVISILPEINLSELKFNKIDRNVYAYLQYHIAKNIQEYRIDCDKKQLQESMKILDEKLGGERIERKVKQSWEIKAEQNIIRLKWQIENCGDPARKEELKTELSRTERIVDARKSNLIEGIGK